ncbi:MAG: branched-chain amino acid ABC transporter permease [Acidimicrobiales bacterium]
MDWNNFVDTFWQNTMNGLSLGAIYALIALGYTLVYGVLRLINFAHSEIFMLGCFGSFATLWALGIDRINGDNPYKSGLELIGILALCLVVSMAISATAAVTLERIAYRPLRKRNAPRLVFLISAIGASFAIAEAVALFGAKGREEYGLPFVLNEKDVLFTVFGADMTNVRFIAIVGAVVMMVLLTTFVSRTRTGRGIRAVAQDAETARLMGVNTDRIIFITFLLGGLMAGGAAFLFELFRGAARYDTGFVLGVKSFTAAVLGGIGNIKGALLGGITLGVVELWGAGLFGGRWTDVIAFVVLVSVLMFRPSGLLGETLGRARA